MLSTSKHLGGLLEACSSLQDEIGRRLPLLTGLGLPIFHHHPILGETDPEGLVAGLPAAFEWVLVVVLIPLLFLFS